MLVWYAAYGSNLSRGRFLRYLVGGAAPGARRGHVGARDARPPTGDVAVQLPGRLHFGWESLTWGGGIAFYVPGEGAVVRARAYLLTEEQFADVAAQEMHGATGTALDLGPVLTQGRDVRGPGRYETLHHVGTMEGRPVLTFTADDASVLPARRPAAAYLRTMAEGLAESHQMAPREVVDYLLGMPVVASTWTRAGLTECLAAPI